MTMHRALMFAIGLVLLAGAAQARPMTDAQIRQQMIRESIRSHGGYCVCPFQLDTRDGRRKHRLCGARSQYNREGGYPPQCYARDISDDAVEGWRNERRLSPR